MNATKMNAIISEVDRQELIGIKAGTGYRCFLSIWMVVVENAIYVRSWGQRKGWYKVFQAEPQGMVSLKSGQYPVEAQFVNTDDPVNDRVDQAFRDKYNAQKFRRYVDDLLSQESLATTVRLLPTGE